jgi:hypothetical protein
MNIQRGYYWVRILNPRLKSQTDFCLFWGPHITIYRIHCHRLFAQSSDAGNSRHQHPFVASSLMLKSGQRHIRRSSCRRPSHEVPRCCACEWVASLSTSQLGFQSSETSHAEFSVSKESPQMHPTDSHSDLPSEPSHANNLHIPCPRHSSSSP